MAAVISLFIFVPETVGYWGFMLVALILRSMLGLAPTTADDDTF